MSFFKRKAAEVALGKIQAHKRAKENNCGSKEDTVELKNSIEGNYDEEDDSSYCSSDDGINNELDSISTGSHESDESEETLLVPSETIEDRTPQILKAVKTIKDTFAARYAYEYGHCPHDENPDSVWFDELTHFFNKKGSKKSTYGRAINCIIRELYEVKEKEYDWDKHFVNRMQFSSDR